MFDADTTQKLVRSIAAVKLSERGWQAAKVRTQCHLKR
jgi:hypothetical protein